MADEVGAGITEETVRPPQPQKKPGLTPKAPEAKEPTPLQKWLDSLEGEKPEDGKNLKKLTAIELGWLTEPQRKLIEEIGIRRNNSFLKVALPGRLENLRQTEAIDHPLTYLIWEIPEGESERGASFHEGVRQYDYFPAGLAQKVEEAINNGNLAAVQAILMARLNYLGKLEGSKELQRRDYATRVKGYISEGESLNESEGEELARFQREVTSLKRTVDILNSRSGVDFNNYDSWEDVLKAPTGPNTPQPIAKAA